MHYMIHDIYNRSYTFTGLSNGDQNVLGFDMVHMSRLADTIPKRYYSAYRK